MHHYLVNIWTRVWS